MSAETKYIEWSFIYEGPINKEDDRACAMCNSVATKKCLRHPSATESCSSCYTARVGFCPNHCGLDEMMQRHEVNAAFEDSFNGISVLLDEFLKHEGQGTTMVAVKAHGFVSEDGLVTLNLSVSAK